MEHSDVPLESHAPRPFERRRRALAAALAALLGTRGAPEPLADEVEAARLVAEHAASREAAEPSEWALVSRAWPGDDVTAVVDTLHRIARNVGERHVWLLEAGAGAQAVATDVGTVLDNPLGFAAATGHRLALLDALVPAGLALTRRSQPRDASTDVVWLLEVWGEPWLSATTRALRGVG